MHVGARPNAKISLRLLGHLAVRLHCTLALTSSVSNMGWLFPFDNLLCMVLGISFTVWFTSLLVFIIVPAILGVSFGIRRLYMNSLLKVFEWATLRMERGAKEKNQHLYKPYSNGIIAKEVSTLEQEIQELRSSSTTLSSDPEFEMADIMSFCRRGVESIVDDEVTKRFSAEELESWNLLTRSNYNFRHISLRLSVLWGLGLLIRYGFLLPLRITLAATGIGLLVILTTIVGFLPSGWLRTYLSEKIHMMCYRICVRALTAIITYHNSENKPKNGGICVANHTTPIDVIILANDGCYSMVGQVHGGIIGVVQRAMVKSSPHIWFERSEVKERHHVAKMLSNHVADKTKHPILIFPEGTCINNTSVMMFKKGSFEIGCTVYPVAIKYDPRFGDAFWNSSKFGMVSYLLRMMSSWAIVCSVWYLPPVKREEGEDAVQFANRVKAAIARQGGLVDLLWDGGLKRAKVKNTFKEEQQKLYSMVLVGDQEDQDEDTPLEFSSLRPEEDEETDNDSQGEEQTVESLSQQEDCSLRLQEDCSLRLQEDCSLRLQEDCSLRLQEDCSLRLQEDCSLRLKEDCSLRLQEDCLLRLQKDCSLKQQEDCTLRLQTGEGEEKKEEGERLGVPSKDRPQEHCTLRPET